MIYDALVVGAGYGGLGAALALAESGAKVAVCESLKYPGGCAGTFTKKGATYDAGATLMSGLAGHQLFGRWVARYAPELPIDWIDPIVELRTEQITLAVPRDRARLVDAVAGYGYGEKIRSFFAEQKRAADVLWRVFDDPSLLPPWSAPALARLAARSFDYAPLLRFMGRPLSTRMAKYGVAEHPVLRVFADALCQITVQCSAAEAETPFAYAAMDYFWRGTAHLPGGMGELAWVLWRALEKLGADVRFKDRVRALVREDGYWRVETRQGTLRARHVVANLVPSALGALVPLDAKTRALGEAVNRGWGAAMIYATATTPAGSREEAHHLELVDDPMAPFTEGNHLFVSISGAGEKRAPDDRRTLTISTHVRLDGGADYIDGVHARMRQTLAKRAPEWSLGTSMTASPRTFARFTGRPGGAVGGIPRRAGLHNYRGLSPHEVGNGLWLVGDSVFPGQSALAAAIGGVRVAAAISKR